MTGKEAKLRAELAAVNDQINAAYWTFTRTKRGAPPSSVVPAAYARRREIESELRRMRRGAGGNMGS